MTNLRFGSEVVIIGVELWIIWIVIGDRDVTTNHPRPAFRTADTERRVLILIHARREPDNDTIEHSFPLHLHPAVEQLNARVKLVMAAGLADFIDSIAATAAYRRTLGRLYDQQPIKLITKIQDNVSFLINWCLQEGEKKLIPVGTTKLATNIPSIKETQRERKHDH